MKQQVKDSKGQEVFAFKFSRLSSPSSVTLLSAQYIGTNESLSDEELDFVQDTYAKELAELYALEYNSMNSSSSK